MASYNYNGFSVSIAQQGQYLLLNTSGGRSKLHQIALRNCTGTVSASVTGGYGWIWGRTGGGGGYMDDLKAVITVSVYLSKGSTTKSLCSATGSATGTGYAGLYGEATSASCNYNLNNLSDSDWMNYDYLNIEYTIACSDHYGAAKWSGSCAIDDKMDGDQGSPYGTASVTVRSDINVRHVDTSTHTLSGINSGSYKIRHLYHQGTQIF